MGDYRVCCLGAETGIPSESLDCIENRSTLTLTSVADPTSIREIEPPRVILTGATVAVDEVIEELVQRGVFDPVVALVDGRSIADVDADDAARVRTARNCPEAVVDRIEAAAERASDRDMPTQHQLDRFEVALAAMGSGLDGLVDSDSTDNLVETLCSRLCGPEAYDAAAYYEYQIELESVELHSMVNTGSVDVDDLFRAPSTTQAALESISTDQSLSLFDSTDEGTNGTVALIPIVYQEIPYGVIAVYADCPAAFGALERRLLAIFGDAIANGIVSLQRKRAITHDDSVELEIALEGPDHYWVGLSDRGDCWTELEGMVIDEGDDGKIRAFIRTDGSMDVIEEQAEYNEWIESVSIVSEEAEDEGRLVELVGERIPIVDFMAKHGMTMREATAESGDGRIVFDIPSDADVRRLVSLMAGESGTAELVARRQGSETIQGTRQFRQILEDALTDRQHEVLMTAYHGGFFQWPRERSGEELADVLDIAQPTFHEHLRMAQQTLLQTLFDDERSLYTF